MKPGSDFELSSTERFDIIRCVGKGAMGAVYEAFDKQQNNTVALKTILHKEAKLLYRLKREFRALQDIEHPNLISLGEFFEESGEWFFTMELVDGVDFLSYIRQEDTRQHDGATRDEHADTDVDCVAEADGPAEPRQGAGSYTFNEARLRAALKQLACGIDALHRAGKIHRDIKPSNIKVTRDGRVVLLDFGLITGADQEHRSTEHHAVGTAAYMAPEQAGSEEVGPSADWYSIGVLMYLSLTGQLPFTGPTMKILLDKYQNQPSPPSKLNPNVPRDLNALCMQLIQYKPSSRPKPRDILSRLGADSPIRSQPSSSLQITQIAPFVGREEELGILQRAFEQTQKDQQAIAVTVFGESGVGKTALIRHFTELLSEDARGSDAPVILSGRCYEREYVPYKAFDGVIDALSRYMRSLTSKEAGTLLPRYAALLPKVFPVLGRIEHFATAPRPRKTVQDPHELRKRIFAALRELLFKIAERHPLIVTIDDLQWSDADSLLLLADLMRPPEEPPLLLLISSREQDFSKILSSDAAGAASIIPGELREIFLEPLSQDGACRLAEILIRQANLADVVSPIEIAREAKGHPLYIDELVRHVSVDGDRKSPLRLDEAIWSRALQLSEQARHLLALIVIADEPLPHDVIRQAAQFKADDFKKHLSILRVSHLVRNIRTRRDVYVEPYHDRVRESVLENIEDSARLQHHRRLAIALETSGGRPVLLLRHLEGAGQLKQAAQVAQQAAQQASEALAFDRAAELYRHALRLSRDEPERLQDLQIDLGKALINAGLGAEAAQVFEAAAENADSVTRLECHRQAAEQWLITGYLEQGLESLRALLAEIGLKLPATPRRALFSLLWHRIKLRLRGLKFNEKVESHIPPMDLLKVDVLKATAVGLSTIDYIRGADFQAREILLALKTGEKKRIARAIIVEAIFLATHGRRGIKRSMKLLERAKSISKEEGDPYLQGWIFLADGFIAFVAGNYVFAADSLLKAENQFRNKTKGSTYEMNVTRLYCTFALTMAGSLAKVKQLIPEYLRDAARRGDRYILTSMGRCGEGRLLLMDDSPEEARRRLEKTQWIAPKDSFHFQHWYELWNRVELAIYEGNACSVRKELQVDFDRFTRSLLNRAQNIRSISFYLYGRLLLAAYETDSVPDNGLLKECLNVARKLHKERVNYASIWSNLLFAGICVQNNQQDDAIAHLQRIIEITKQYTLLNEESVAKRRLGELLGGQEGEKLVQESEDWMNGQGVKNPRRFAQVFAPGFNQAEGPTATRHDQAVKGAEAEPGSGDQADR